MKTGFWNLLLLLAAACVFWNCGGGRGARDHDERRSFGGGENHGFERSRERRSEDPGRVYGSRQAYGVRWGYEVHDRDRGSGGDHHSHVTFESPGAPDFEMKRHGDGRYEKNGFFDFINDWTLITPAPDPDGAGDEEEDVYNTCPNPCINYRANQREIGRIEGQIKYLYSVMNDGNKDTLQDQIGALQYEKGDLQDEDKSLSRKAENCGCLK